MEVSAYPSPVPDDEIFRAMPVMLSQPDHLHKGGIAVNREARAVTQVRLKFPDNLPTLTLGESPDFLALIVDGQLLLVC